MDLNDLLNGNIESNKLQTEFQKENIKTIEIDSPKTDYNSMSVKQLKDIAKANGLKASGTKQELVQILLAHNEK